MIEQIDAVLDEIMQRPRMPRATYRLQFNADFTFQDAAALVDYLHELGISDLYASPLFRPRSGSTHGYDTINYNEFNPVLGSEDDFNQLVETLRDHEMGLLLDIVPNHMGVNTENLWWMDVLKQGPSSEYAHYFDIDWYPQNRLLDNKVLIPILGDHFGRVLEAGELKLVYWHGDFYLHYYEHQFPITPDTYGIILAVVLDLLLEQGGYEDWVEMELSSVIHSIQYLPLYTTRNPDEAIARRREQVIIRWRLLGLFDKSEVFRTAIQAGLEKVNGDPQVPSSFDMLDGILARQPYRLSYWRVATDEINYRRFFDINDMAAIRIEAPQVFEDTHRLALSLLAEGKVSGLRIDHPDGLWDPEAYFRRLQEAYLRRSVEYRLGKLETDSPISDRLEALRQAQVYPPRWPVYVLVEKILSETEPLPLSWAVYGTTGYDFLYAVNNLLVNADNESAINTTYSDFIGEEIDFAELTDYTKKLVMSQSLTSEIDARSVELARIVEQDRRYRGFTQNSLAFGMSEIIAALPIYRTYITGPGTSSERDDYYIRQAVKLAKKRNPLTPGSMFDFLQDTLLMDNWLDFPESLRPNLREFIMKFQQITGPVMAKSVEDTAFYIYNRLTSLNEVGGHPERFGSTPADFHSYNVDKDFPHTMLTTSTHDAKRSEDVRARISVLSELPDEWRDMLAEWSNINNVAKSMVNSEPAPSRNDEYLLYQSMIGAFPIDTTDLDTFRDRVIRYMHKAINEAKTHSNWINPNDAYARAIADFVIHILEDDRFRQSFDPFQRRIAFFGYFNALTQTLLKMTSPGMPDFYQGNELWCFSLVDPDNRRPVDFEQRRATLEAIKSANPIDLLSDIESGAIKLYLTYRTLNYRRDHEALFRDGDYVPLETGGKAANHVVAFLRQDDDHTALVVVPRLIAGLTSGDTRPPTGADLWHDTHLILPRPFATGNSILTDSSVPVHTLDDQPVVYIAEALAEFPVSLIEMETN